MLPESKINSWIKRDLDNFDGVKGLSRKELIRDIKDLSPRPKFYGQRPWTHQLACFLIGVHNPEFLYFLDMGMGKSRLILDILQYAKRCGKFKKGLVVVPNLTNIDSWVDEGQLYAPKLKLVPLFGSSIDRFDTLDNVDGDLYIINNQGLVSMFTHRAKDKKGKMVTNINMDLVNKYKPMFQAFACDESELIKNIHSFTYRLSLHFSGVCTWKFGLTGTPMNKDPQEFWPQFFVIDRGETLGPTLTFFRDIFYKRKSGYWTKYEYTFIKNKSKDFNRILKNRSISYKIDEAMDMPRRVSFRRKLEIPEEAALYYDKVVDQVIKADKNYTLMKSSYARMRQISSGYATIKDEESGKRKFIEFKHNPKLDELINLIKQVPTNRKILVVHFFVHSGKMISDRLKKEKIPHKRLWGGQKDKRGTVKEFRYGKGDDTLVMNYKSGGRGLNLQSANYVFFYESPDSASLREQVERRIWRGGQKRTCFFGDLIVKGTKDEAILAANKAGRNLLSDLIRGKQAW